VTPDSFTDGGAYLDPHAAIAHGRALVDQGADILDIGGESTRPSAADVPEEEEISRILPVIEALRDAGAVISVDTRKPAVMRAAVQAGAAIVNDVAALSFSDDAPATAAALGVPVILGHMRGSPAEMKALAEYDDVVTEVTAELAGRRDAALAAGVEHRNILLDPGFGFAKKPTHNAALLARLDALATLGHPIVIGPSRKLFSKAAMGSVDERLAASLAAALIGVQRGAAVLRVHDVAETVQALAVLEAVERTR
jgi:dihydropteroate synthase